MTDPSGMSTSGQFEGLVVIAAYGAVAVAVRARRAKVRQARKLRALRRVQTPCRWHTERDPGCAWCELVPGVNYWTRELSGGPDTVGPTTSQDRSER